ncbi:MAG: ATP-dependent DNA ligase [Alphaproteobacteria bacterium]|nr:ATP-dependent DNA ligase [Alphaproteobacteria bacterium]
MLAKGQSTLPEGPGWLYEPKWDGFRVLVFRDGPEIHLQSRDRKPLLRYFPEVAEPLLRALPERCVVDGELVIRGPDGLSFGALQLRLHPAASRVAKLAGELPASVVLWDLLAVGDTSLLATPFRERRAALEREVAFADPVFLTPLTDDPAVARGWFERFEGAGLDGVVAKPAEDVYQPGKRAMCKVKRTHSIDCVLAGFRWHKSGEGVGSLVLALWDGEGRLQQIGVASSFTAKRRKELVAELEPLREGAREAHPWSAHEEAWDTRKAGTGSRWSQGRDLSWEPLRLERVVEVEVNQVTDGRLRHPGRFVRWRTDRDPASCTFDQLEVRPAEELMLLFGAGETR